MLPGQIECSCGRGYWPSQRWIHAGCATNKPATNAVATNRIATNERTANRRSRESYNAYQREYMRKRRAVSV